MAQLSATIPAGKTIVVNGIPFELATAAEVSGYPGNFGAVEGVAPGTFVFHPQPHTVDQCTDQCQTSAPAPSEPYPVAQARADYQAAEAEAHGLTARHGHVKSLIRALQTEEDYLSEATWDADKRVQRARDVLVAAVMASPHNRLSEPVNSQPFRDAPPAHPLGEPGEPRTGRDGWPRGGPLGKRGLVEERQDEAHRY